MKNNPRNPRRPGAGLIQDVEPDAAGWRPMDLAFRRRLLQEEIGLGRTAATLKAARKPQGARGRAGGGLYAAMVCDVVATLLEAEGGTSQCRLARSLREDWARVSAAAAGYYAMQTLHRGLNAKAAKAPSRVSTKKARRAK